MGSCWICCEGEASEAPLLATGCGCRGSAGLAHLRCLVTAATHDVQLWTTCPTCHQEFTGEVDVGLARARWEIVRERPAEDAERCFVAMNLAVTLKESAGDNAGALTLMQEVVAVRRRVLGDTHPHTLDSITNLALQHAEMGELTAALPLNEEALAAMRRLLGDEHEHTLVSLTSLGALHNALGDYGTARPLHEEALAAKRRTLGGDHLETMNSAHLLGVCLVKLSDEAQEGDIDAVAPGPGVDGTVAPRADESLVAQGLALLEESAATARRVLGESHPSTVHFEAGLADARGARRLL